MKYKKRLIYFVFLITMTGIILELSPFVISPLIYKQSFSKKKLQSDLLQKQKQNTIKEDDGNKKDKANNHENEYLGGHILHPYLGFVGAPNLGYNRFCFPGPDPITQKSNDTINICLMGGSVALGLYQTSKTKLIESLQKSAYFKEKEIKIVALALPGYKQPQQLMALNYFLSLGAYYDIIINLDGFNEIVLPFSDNLPFNVYPSYPRHWNIYSRKRLNSRVQLLLSNQIGLRDEWHKLNVFFIEKHLYHSNFGMLLWDILNKKKRTSALNIEEKIRLAVSQSESDYQSTGPAETITDTTQFFIEQAKLWQKSSALIGGLKQSIGFEYFHFLQPNQYYENSKELSEEELQTAYENGPFSYKTAVQVGYPFLIYNGKYLVDQGINYFDLTLMFKNEKRTVYNDKCCHFNELGYDLIAEKISKSVLYQFDKNKIPSKNP